jgi:regulator of replication initiation timing
MKYFLLLIILGLCGGGYYEFTLFQQKSADAQQQISDLSAKIDTLNSENTKLADDNTKLKKSADDATADAADLTKQLQDAQSELAAAKAQAVQAQAALAKASQAATNAPATTAPTTNSLGTITTLDGKSYQNCQLLNIKTNSIVVNYAEGITEISYSLMPPDLQKRFGYDPRQAAALTEAQIEYQEEQRKAASQAAGN